MTRLATDDIDALTDLVTQGVVAILGDVFLLVGDAVLLVVLDWRLALVILASIPVVAGSRSSSAAGCATPSFSYACGLRASTLI